MANIFDIPREVLTALLFGDYSGACKRLEPLARNQEKYFQRKHDWNIKRVEQVFEHVNGRDPWINTSASYQIVYRMRIARYADVLGVEHLCKDIREVGDKARSLKYFIVPGADRVCRWEMHCIDLHEQKIEEQRQRWAEEDAASEYESLLPNAQKKAEQKAIPDFAHRAARNVQSLLRKGDTAAAERIRRQQMVTFKIDLRITGSGEKAKVTPHLVEGS